jgi:hypothetical protein
LVAAGAAVGVTVTAGLLADGVSSGVVVVVVVDEAADG